MTTLTPSVLSADLDFLISETGKEYVGVSPSNIEDKVFFAAISTVTEGYEVELAGREVIIDAEIMLNGDAYDTLPEKFGVIKDRDNVYFKVLEVKKEDFGPAYTLKVVSRYAAGD